MSMMRARSAPVRPSRQQLRWLCEQLKHTVVCDNSKRWPQAPAKVARALLMMVPRPSFARRFSSHLLPPAALLAGFRTDRTGTLLTGDMPLPGCKGRPPLVACLPHSAHSELAGWLRTQSLPALRSAQVCFLGAAGGAVSTAAHPRRGRSSAFVRADVTSAGGVAWLTLLSAVALVQSQRVVRRRRTLRCCRRPICASHSASASALRLPSWITTLSCVSLAEASATARASCPLGCGRDTRARRPRAVWMASAPRCTSSPSPTRRRPRSYSCSPR